MLSVARYYQRAIEVAALMILFGSNVRASGSETRWTMLNVEGSVGQADCHLLQFPDGKAALIDAAEAGDAPGAAVNQLKRAGVTHLAFVVISHFHADHYGRLLSIMDAGITVDRVIGNLPADRRIADRERPWGCNFDDVLATLASLRERNVPYDPAKAGERLFDIQGSDGTEGSVDVICAYDGINTPIGETDINDTSIIVRLTFGPTSVLFTGDLNQSLGAYLATSGVDLKSDILKAPHHGTEGCAPNTFFDRVEPSVVLIPAPKSLWFSDRSRRIRDYFAIHDTPVYVNGVSGNVTVTLSSSGFTIVPEIVGGNAESHVPPKIVNRPESVSATPNKPFTLTVSAKGDPPLMFQWFKNGTPVSGANSPNLQFDSLSPGDAGAFAVRVTNPAGCAATAPMKLTVDRSTTTDTSASRTQR